MYFLDLFLVLYVKEEMGDWFYNACFKIQYTVEFFLQDRHIFVYSHLQILVTLWRLSVYNTSVSADDSEIYKLHIVISLAL